jgi:hypothetical protein
VKHWACNRLALAVVYTVHVSFREHGLVAEPFLVVGWIAVVRRILLITAELQGREYLAASTGRLRLSAGKR